MQRQLPHRSTHPARHLVSLRIEISESRLTELCTCARDSLQPTSPPSSRTPTLSVNTHQYFPPSATHRLQEESRTVLQFVSHHALLLSSLSLLPHQMQL